MRILCLLLTLINCLCIGIFSSWASSPDEMISYWKLEEDATSQDFVGYSDSSNLTNLAACSGSCPSINTGVVNNSQVFNGTNTGIDVPANVLYDFNATDSFSIELWVKRLPGISSREVLIGRDDALTSMQWWLLIDDTGKPTFSLVSSEGESNTVVGSKSIDNARWHHIAFVRDNINEKNLLYIDGKLDASESIIYSSGFDSTRSINIGYLYEDSADFFFNGELDEVAIYERVLTLKEIRMHYYLSRDYCETNATPVKIMPLGDSITFDSHSGETRPLEERTGYRWPLWLWLSNGSYWVDFIGSEKAGQNITPAFDYDHAGFPGITDDQLAVLLDTGINQFPEPDKVITDGPYLPFYPPDVILLHIGTNILETNTTGIENVLNEIDEYSEHVTVVLAKIINRINYSQDTTDYNTNVEIMANNRIANGDKIIIVDMENGAGIIYDFTANGGDMYDDLHPDLVVDPYVVDSGYGKMADKWFATLQNILPLSSLPSITSTPGTSLNHGETYTYQILVEGSPGPSVDLTEPNPFPENFQYDAASNTITWVPNASSPDLDVAIQASNWVGTDVQNFTILVNDAPVLADIPDRQIDEGASFAIINLDDYVDDPDGSDENISWTYSGNTDLVINIVDRKLSVNVVDQEWYGTETVTFRATDPGGLYAEDDVIFEVTNVNDAPVISGFTPLTVTENDTFAIGYDILAVADPDNEYPDDFTKTIYGGSNYAVSGDLIIPSNGFVGKLHVPVSVNDGVDESNIRNIIVTVEEGNGDDSDNNDGNFGLCFIGAISM